MPKNQSRQNRKNIYSLAAAAVVSLSVSALVLSGRTHPQAADAAVPQASSAPLPSATPTASLAKMHVNEVGRVPILMYHSVGDPPITGKLSHLGLSISAALFRKNLEQMYEADFYPINMRDLFSPRVAIPAGKIPVVLTFDDARGSQFRYRKDGSIDPNCVVGILEEFHKKHPDGWPQRASFYVLPSSKYNPIPFWQGKQDQKKFQFLTKAGYEIANHSTSHRPMARMDAKTLAWEMKFCKDYVLARDKSATMDTMALPYGIAPNNKALWSVLLGGKNRGYENKCILLAAGDAAYCPWDKRWDKTRVMRIGSEPGNIERWIAALKRNRTAPSKVTLRPYVSDGDPDTIVAPASQAKNLNKSAIGDLRLVTYNDIPPAAAKSAAKKSKATKTKKIVPTTKS